MIFPIRCDGPVFQRRDACEFPEVLNQVGLVVIAMLESDVHPGELIAAHDLIQDGLKTLDATIQFGGQPDCVLKLSNESLAAESHLVHVFQGTFGTLFRSVLSENPSLEVLF